MRYYSIDSIAFTNANGKTVQVKDILPLEPKSKNTVNLRLQNGDKLDEIASRFNVYGEGHETDAYKIFAENVEDLTFVNFDLSKLKTLRIPQ